MAKSLFDNAGARGFRKSSEIMTPIIGYAGMTHLGLNSAAASSAHEFETVGFDPDVNRINQLQKGLIPVNEPGLQDLLTRHEKRLTFSSEAESLKRCHVVYISADVATDNEGQSDLRGIQDLIATVLPNLSSTAVLVILCQVPPGFTRNILHAKERLFYQVETLIFGRAVERAMFPERYIVGRDIPERAIPTSYKTFLDAFDCPLLPMQYESAELAKISINCCLVGMISVANTLAEMCEHIGADWGEIVPALKLDKRIGPSAYLNPGLGLAGGNLERDLATVCRLAEEHGTDPGVVQAWIQNSRYRKDWALRILHSHVLGKGSDLRLGILGLAYKEDTHSTKNSPSLAMIACLKDWPIQVYDPVVSSSVLDHPSVVSAESSLEVAQGVDALVIMTPWAEFREVKLAGLRQAMKGNVIVDPFQVLSGSECTSVGFKYYSLGRPLHD